MQPAHQLFIDPDLVRDAQPFAAQLKVDNKAGVPTLCLSAAELSRYRDCIRPAPPAWKSMADYRGNVETSVLGIAMVAMETKHRAFAGK